MKKLLLILFTISISYSQYSGNVLMNAGFEDTSATGKGKWQVYPSNYSSFAHEHESTTMFGSNRKYPSYWGEWGFKMWGRYDGTDNENSIFQTFSDVPAGKHVSFTGMAMTYNEDRIRGGNKAFLFIKSFDASYNTLQLSFSDSIDADAPADRWLSLLVEQKVPANAKYTQIGMGLYQPKDGDDNNGGIYFDDLIAYIGDVIVDISVNTSHIKDLTQSKRKMMVDLRGPSEIANPAWGPGTNFRPFSSFGWSSEDIKDIDYSKHLDHDWWYMPIALDKDKTYQYKFGGHISNLDGTVSGLWENDLPGANYQGDNRSLTISADGSSSTATGAYHHEYEAEFSDEYYHHVMHFLGRGPSNDAPPFTEKEDSVDVYFVVNMSNAKDYTGQQVYMAGDLESEVTGGGDWIYN